MAKHLHPEAGGNPSQSAKGKMANPTPDPGSGNDFPDAPDEAAAAGDDGDERSDD